MRLTVIPENLKQTGRDVPMKVLILQPPYSLDPADADLCFDAKMDLLDRCDSSADIIVLPEYSDVPCVTRTMEETLGLHNKFIQPLMDKCTETARRCKAVLFVDALSEENGHLHNTTFCYDRSGILRGTYFKLHLPPFEKETLHIEPGIEAPAFMEPYTLDIDGIRYAFLTCYDFYYYEYFSRLAKVAPDIIIGCSLQRSDTHSSIETMCRFLAYNTNAYVLRSSVSFSEDSDICGASMAVSPRGDVLANMYGAFGILEVEFDPCKKYLKPAGFGAPDASHHKYVEYGRSPWLYRPAGSFIIPGDQDLPYPRVCAHRGFSAVAPENSLPAFGAAVALGTDEIEFDLWPTSDGEIVSMHDQTLDRVSNGTGIVWKHTFHELEQLDFGSSFSEHFAGLRVLSFEEILRRLACHTIMNIHIKPLPGPYDADIMKKIVDLIRMYDCTRHVYFMIERDENVALFRSYAPEIPICLGHDEKRPWQLVERAIQCGADKVQLFKPYIRQEMVDLAHSHDILCNVFYADDPAEAQAYLQMGIDTILTNEYLSISRVIASSSGGKKYRYNIHHT